MNGREARESGHRLKGSVEAKSGCIVTLVRSTPRELNSRGGYWQCADPAQAIVKPPSAVWAWPEMKAASSDDMPIGPGAVAASNPSLTC
jgi:hypothetical protein